MVSNFLLIGSVLLVIFSYFCIFVNYFIYKKKIIDDYSGFDVVKEVTSNYDEINIVSSRDVILSEYDIKRNVVRLNNKNYDGNSCFDVAVSALLAGCSLVNLENKNYFKFSFIVRKLCYIGFVSLIGVILSFFIRNIGDAKIGIVILGLLLIYQYMRYQISVIAINKIKESLNKDIYNKINKVLDGFNIFDKLSFITMLLLILRLVVIIMEI